MPACFAKIVPAPGPGAITKARMVQLIADLKASELAKSDCGRRLLSWYATQAAALRAK